MPSKPRITSFFEYLDGGVPQVTAATAQMRTNQARPPRGNLKQGSFLRAKTSAAREKFMKAGCVVKDPQSIASC
jgi:hypothetical protein